MEPWALQLVFLQTGFHCSFSLLLPIVMMCKPTELNRTHLIKKRLISNQYPILWRAPNSPPEVWESLTFNKHRNQRYSTKSQTSGNPQKTAWWISVRRLKDVRLALRECVCGRGLGGFGGEGGRGIGVGGLGLCQWQTVKLLVAMDKLTGRWALRWGQKWGHLLCGAAHTQHRTVR